jgi:tRNA dimethylallyltransferase
MSPANFQHALVLTGPTGSGKSAQAVALAPALNAEIVCMDSMTLYRGMDIGTAKPTLEERRGVSHHLIDVLEPWESASVAWWLEQAARCCRDIEARGKTALFVGGTALYLKAMLFGLFEGPDTDAALRRQLYKVAEVKGPEHLYGQLATVDPASAARLHPNDVRRVVRALEVWQLTGQPLSQWQRQWDGQRPDIGPRCVWLDWPRAALYARIDARVLLMFEQGLAAEVAKLLQSPQALSREARQALGYKETMDHLEGRATLDETIATMQQRSRNFAKRQITWFRHLPGCYPVSGELTTSLWDRRMSDRV